MRDRALAVYRPRRCVAGAASMACAPRTAYRPTSPALPSADDVNKLLADPHLAAALPRDQAATLYARIAPLEATLRARLLVNDAAEQCWTAEQVAQRLGLTTEYVFALARQGALRCVRIGKYVRIPESAMVEYLAKHEHVYTVYSRTYGPQRTSTTPTPAGTDAGGTRRASRRHPHHHREMGEKRGDDHAADGEVDWSRVWPPGQDGQAP
jgi:excisionase family DNA binding protein